MRFVVLGAGAIGGVVGGFLARSGADVALVARGRHGELISTEGLRVRTPGGEFVVHPPVAVTPSELGIGDDDVVLLAVKSQDTARALDDLMVGGATGSTPIVCLQNGVDNERHAAERFENVYGVVVMAPTLFLDPGVVEAKAGPVPAILDIGRYPAGVDTLAADVSAAFVAAGMASRVVDDVMRWKWTKLLLNLGNAIEVVCGPGARVSELGKVVNREGRAVLAAAGVDHASAEEDRDRRGDVLRWTPSPDSGGSTWQSVARGAGSVETDHITGEIVRLGHAHGVPVPANELLLRLAHEVADGRRALGATDPAEVLAVATDATDGGP